MHIAAKHSKGTQQQLRAEAVLRLCKGRSNNCRWCVFVCVWCVQRSRGKQLLAASERFNFLLTRCAKIVAGDNLFENIFTVICLLLFFFIFSRYDFNEMCLISSARTKLQLARAFCWCASKSSDAKVLPAMMMRATCTTTNVEYKVLWICTECSRKVHKERCFQIFRRYLYMKQDNKPKYTCWSFWILYQ